VQVTIQHEGAAGISGAKMKTHEFSFDKVFAPSVGQEDVFAEVHRPPLIGIVCADGRDSHREKAPIAFSIGGVHCGEE
jgi:hypothetical protein